MSEERMEHIEELVEAAKSPGVFNILDVLKERAYPVEEIDIYIDESIAYSAAEIDKQIKQLEAEADSAVGNSEELDVAMTRLDELMKQRDEIIEKIGGNKYIFTITGISEGVREDLFNKSLEEYPMMYRDDKNPFTGEVKREEVEDKDRNRLFTNLLWREHIVKITAPNGSVQNGLTIEEAVELRRSLPLVASGKITEAIENIRAATAIFMMTVEEDFLAKS